MPTAMDVAEYFLAAAPTEEPLTNLKLQKLCAYAQAVSLAYAGVTLFEEEIQAWTHGPVVPSVYTEFRENGSNAIPPRLSLGDALAKFSETEKYILQMTWLAYGRFTAWALRDQSHWDFPGAFGSMETIPVDKIRAAFTNNPLVQRMHHNDVGTETRYALDV